jgi:hypothetical protein
MNRALLCTRTSREMVIDKLLRIVARRIACSGLARVLTRRSFVWKVLEHKPILRFLERNELAYPSAIAIDGHPNCKLDTPVLVSFWHIHLHSFVWIVA